MLYFRVTLRFEAYSYCQNENTNGRLASLATEAERQFLFDSFAHLTRYADVMDPLWFGAHGYNWKWQDGNADGDTVKLVHLCPVLTW